MVGSESKQAACAARGLFPGSRSGSEDPGGQHTQRHQLRPARDTDRMLGPQRISGRVSPSRIARL